MDGPNIVLWIVSFKIYWYKIHVIKINLIFYSYNI